MNTTGQQMAFEDGLGEVFIGASANEIVRMMKQVEFDIPPTPEIWKTRVAMRALYLGIEIQYYDALSFLCELERHGLGRFRPELLDNNSGLADLV